jgi:hypothetical protein
MSESSKGAQPKNVSSTEKKKEINIPSPSLVTMITEDVVNETFSNGPVYHADMERYRSSGLEAKDKAK